MPLAPALCRGLLHCLCAHRDWHYDASHVVRDRIARLHSQARWTLTLTLALCQGPLHRALAPSATACRPTMLDPNFGWTLTLAYARARCTALAPSATAGRPSMLDPNFGWTLALALCQGPLHRLGALRDRMPPQRAGHLQLHRRLHLRDTRVPGS